MRQQNLLFSVLFASLALVLGVSANCAKCQKIESERAEEQAKNPADAGYYDDYLKKQQKVEPKAES